MQPIKKVIIHLIVNDLIETFTLQADFLDSKWKKMISIKLQTPVSDTQLILMYLSGVVFKEVSFKHLKASVYTHKKYHSNMLNKNTMGVQ